MRKNHQAMAPCRQRCPGCFQDFASSTVIQNHIKQSQNPACQIAYDALIEANLLHDKDFDMHSDLWKMGHSLWLGKYNF